MKTICSAALAAIILSIPAHGQGQVQFENYSIDAPIFGPDGNGLGPEARVQFFLDGMWLGGPATFEATVPGYFFGGVVETPGHPPGSRAVFHVRAWIGESYDAARIRGETVSEPTRLFQGGGAPPDTVRFESFTIPEPRTAALLVAGAAAILLLRAHKRSSYATILALFLSSSTAHAQSHFQYSGEVQFENYTIDAPISGPDGQGLGPEARVQLFLNGTWFGEPEPFHADVAGYFFAGIVNTPQFVFGERRAFFVRAWIGESYDTASIRGETLSEPVFIAGGLGVPETVRFESFTIPEPRVITLVLGGAIILLLRRPSILSILSKTPGQPKHNLVNNTHPDHEQHLVVTRNQSVSE